MPRSQRIRKPRFKTDDVKETENDHPMDEPAEEYKPPTKRPRKAKAETIDEHNDVKAPPKKKARKAGRLLKLLEMPLDIVNEIFASSHPLDLLRASRASKSFHKLLMARAARPIWIASWQTLPDAPACPEDMIEPVFTRLAFELVCQSCGASGVRNVLWSLRLRVCAKCLDSNQCGLVNMSNFYNTTDETHLAASRLIPWADGFGKYRHVSFCLQSDVDKVVAQLKALRRDSPEYASFIEECQAKLAQRKQWSDHCKAWMDDQVSERSSDLEAARHRRKEAIKDRLIQMGFGKEFEWMELHRWPVAHVHRAFKNLKCVKQPRELTDRVWMNIEHDLLTFMDSVRQKRLADTWLCVLKKRVSILGTLLKERTPAHTTVPRVMDVYTMPTIREVLERPLDVNEEDEVSKDTFSSVLLDMPAVLAHAESARHALISKALLQSEISPSDPTDADLHLPQYVFACPNDRCRQAFTYVQAKAHRCSASHSAFMSARPYETDWAVSDPDMRLEMVCSWVPESGGLGSVIVSKAYSRRARLVIQMAGLEPRTATFEEMDTLAPWFACSCWSCRSEVGYAQKRILDWRSAVDHHLNASEAELEVLTGEDRDKAVAKWEAYEVKLPISGSPESRRDVWACARCEVDVVNTQTIRSHLLEAHGVDAPQYTTDFKYSANCYAPRRDVCFGMQGSSPTLGDYLMAGFSQAQYRDLDDFYDEEDYYDDEDDEDEDDDFLNFLAARVMGAVNRF